MPGVQNMHRMGAALPQECVAITAQVFVSMQYNTIFRVPSYTRWLEHDAFDRAMWAVTAATVSVPLFYWFAGSFYIGPRYWFIAALPVVWLSARGFAALPGGEGKNGMLLVLIVSGVLVFLP